jgi:four helix bundle protein
MLSHKSLLAWQEAEWVSSAVLDISRDYWRPFAQAVFGQVQRSSLSVQVNIAEGYAFTNTPTFRRHLSISYGSSIETGELLETLLKKGLIPPDPGTELVQRCFRSQKLLLGLLKRYGNQIHRFEPAASNASPVHRSPLTVHAVSNPPVEGNTPQ